MIKTMRDSTGISPNVIIGDLIIQVDRGTVMQSPRVFITQEVPTANYSTAEDFGRVEVLTASELSHIRNSAHNRRLVALLRDRLSDFNPSCDFIAPSGSPIITGLVFAILHEKINAFNVLKWNARDRMYVPLFINIEENEIVQ